MGFGLSVRPAHLDELVRTVEAGGSYVEMHSARDEDDVGLGGEEEGWSRRRMRAGSLSDCQDEDSNDMFRELEVARIQMDHLHRQVRSTFAEVELHKEVVAKIKVVVQAAEHA